MLGLKEIKKTRRMILHYNGDNAIFHKAAFKKPIQNQRCLVVADV
jgi:hypothetical protein